MKRFIGVALAGIVLLGFGLAAGACSDSGGGTLTLEEYFTQLAALSDEFDTKSAELDGQFSALSEEEALAQGKGLLDEQAGVFATFAGGVEDLNAPDEVEAEHDAAVEALNELTDLFRGFVDELPDEPASVDELFGGIPEDELDAASTRTSEACNALQQIATDNEIDADLACSE